MAQSHSKKDDYFTLFSESIEAYSLPDRFTNPFNYTPHPLCLLAVKELQYYLKNQEDWIHNFGLDHKKKGTIIGKMFGVLIVQTQEGIIGYLSAFSGKLAGKNHHAKFVPPVFDMLTKGSFLNKGMEALTRINKQIKMLEEENESANNAKIASLKEHRKSHSISLQEKLFDQYHFLNQAGEEKSLREIFQALSKNPPSAAGECAAPKLLQYAFQHKLKPVAMGEFWWGLSPKSDFWKHGHFYPACQNKCQPILGHMLAGIEMEEGRR